MAGDGGGSEGNKKSMPILLRKKEKEGVKMNLLSDEELRSDMDELLATFGAKRDQADINKTRQILGRFGSVNEELEKMREENR